MNLLILPELLVVYAVVLTFGCCLKNALFLTFVFGQNQVLFLVTVSVDEPVE